MVEGGPGGFDPEAETSRERDLINLFSQVRALKVCFAVGLNDGRFEVKGINNTWGITEVGPKGVVVSDSSRGFELNYSLDDFLRIQREAIRYYTEPSHLVTPDDRLAPSYLENLAIMLDVGRESGDDPGEGAATKTPREPGPTGNAPNPDSPFPDNPEYDDPIEVTPDAATSPDANSLDWEGPSVFDLPEEAPVGPSSTAVERDVTLRHAVGYLENSDTSALMKERKSRKGAKAVMGRIGDRLRAGPFSRGVVMGSNDSARLNAIKEAVSDVYTGGEKLKKALGEGTADVKNQKFDRDKIEMLVRYKEALRLSDEAVKLIREIPFADEARAIEIDGQLNNLHEHLMILAHEDSYKILYDFEETITRKKRLSDRRFFGLASNPDFDQGLNETLAEYHDRVRPKEVKRTLKDVRVLYNGNPEPNSDPGLRTERDENGFTPDMGKTRHYYEQEGLKNVKPHPEIEAEHVTWARNFIDA